MTQASMMNAPTNMPGNKPAKKTVAGNLLHRGWREVAAALDVFVGVAVGLADEAVLEAEVELADADVVPDLLALVRREQTALSWSCPAMQA
jgi:hypothetical protein